MKMVVIFTEKLVDSSNCLKFFLLGIAKNLLTEETIRNYVFWETSYQNLFWRTTNDLELR